MKGKRQFSDRYRSPIRDSLCLQVFFIFVSSLVLDGGGILRYSIFALVPTWTLILLIVLRRPAEPTPLDLKVVRFSYLTLWILLLLFSALFGALGE